MYRPLSTLIAQTACTAGTALLLTLGTWTMSAPPAFAADCPEGTEPTSAVDGNQQCAPVPDVTATPQPTPTPSPTDLPPAPTDEPSTDPSPVPTPTAVPKPAPAVVLPPPAAPAPDEPPDEVVTPAPAPVPAQKTLTPPKPMTSPTPTPAVLAPEPPATADLTGVMDPGDGPRLLWAVAAGASASGLLAAIVAFYLVSIRPYLLARKRPGALG